MGDMLVKSGDWQTAQKIYQNAKRAKEYENWKYRVVLDDRNKEAQATVARFNAPSETSNARTMINSEFSCMAYPQE